MTDKTEKHVPCTISFHAKGMRMQASGRKNSIASLSGNLQNAQLYPLLMKGNYYAIFPEFDQEFDPTIEYLANQHIDIIIYGAAQIILHGIEINLDERAEIMLIPYEKFSSISMNSETPFNIHYRNTTSYAYDQIVYSAKRIKEVYIREAVGSLSFQQAQNTINEYDINAQSVKLESSDRSNDNALSIEISSYSNEEASDGYSSSLKVTGIVNSAKIIYFDLFPTFIGWYKENITLIPLSLVTAIFGGVALLKKSKEKEKE